ncbi:heparan-alpha-glucosaminide N-acetyltransferase domain-containing protein [Arthrobacter oryzae]|uniref:heparan-alpha-glucosaminide N-acetyltransferase domain-containing protein n=1 Tax=Arthrobacter oryzae TaxID=409290 RepID=UPI00273C2D5B|nr:heparan-alpha-glucosaminide N-acetyltransferase domain-containing protein [Arthrobacter oryzae]WLQ05430.1 heparan-alpha-glucosaminide N-acetyltransferase domain-containing protein [Arthrobacter oryzae]
MTSRGTASPSRTAPGTTKTTRLTGIDAARGLALLGMMATHLLPTFEADAQLTPTWIGLTFSGRAAALFAVLAGIGLALSTGKQRPLQGQELSGARRGIALRALVIAVVGLFLGGLEVNVAVILVHYAVLFLCVLPFIGLGIKPLCALAAGWVVGSPVLAYLLRPWLLAPSPALKLGHNPNWDDLATPGRLLGDIFLTGYYPVLQWLSYLLIGLLIGRLALAKATIQVLLLAGGTVVAVLAKWLGVLAMDAWGGKEALQARLADPRYPLDSLLQVNLAGIDQSGSWWWLASSAPHSGTTLDLLHTSAVAAAVVGACLLLGRLGEWLALDLLLPLRGAGAMTLSLYTAHVCLVAAMYLQPLPAGWTEEGVYAAQALTAVLIGGSVAVLSWRGPLEWVAHAASEVGRYQRSGVR